MSNEERTGTDLKKTDGKNAGRPLYRELAERIREDIFLRNLGDGDFYCTMKSLCGKFRTSFITVRNAIALLEAENMVLCRPAMGVYVKNINRLKLLNSLDNMILILSRYEFAGGHPFYEARLSAMMQVLAEEGFSPHVCHGGNVEPAENLEVLGSQAKGILASECYYDLLRNGNVGIRCLPSVFFHRMPLPSNRTGKECFVVCDMEDQNRRCCEFLRPLRYGKLVYVTQDLPFSASPAASFSAMIPHEIEEVRFPNTRPDIDTGRNLALQLMRMPRDTIFWVTDDYVALGIYDAMLKRGVDLIAEKRIVVNSSPAFEITEQLGFPVFGFSPHLMGMLAAKALVQMLKHPGTVSGDVRVPVSVNRNV